MTLIKSISGIRGTIGGSTGDNLTPIDIVKFTCAFASLIQEKQGRNDIKVVLGRDARISGEMVSNLVSGALRGMGANVLDLGLSTTPTVEVSVPMEKADAGIILTASHNPKQWNALKLLNHKGEFISAADGAKVLEIASTENIEFADVDSLGTYSTDDTYIDKHVQMILDLPLVDVEAIRNSRIKVVCDCVNSTGGLAVPALLEALGVEVVKLYCEPNGHFPHNPEPLPEHLTDLSESVKDNGADFGIVVDPDVDRLALVCEDGSMFGEEYTLVAVSDYVLQHTPGNTVSNLSSTRALRDVTQSYGVEYHAAAVGEVNVVEKMKAVNAVIGGEGNGGVIYPELHYGRDSLVGIALFLSLFVKSNRSCSELRDSYPKYVISKNKIQLTPQINTDEVLNTIRDRYANEEVNTIDGVKIDFPDGWLHLRKSNTEPIIRIYAEGNDKASADALASKIMNEIKSITE